MRNTLSYIVCSLIYCVPFSLIHTQELIQLEQLHQWAIQHYPLTRQKELIQENNSLHRKNIQAAFLPQAQLIGQGSWQSEVTSLPIKVPGITPEELAKDQYRLYLDVYQLIYDGGQLKFQQKIAETSAQIENEKISVDHQKIKEKVNQLYIQLFLLETQRKQISLIKQDFENAIKKVQAQVDNGISFRSALYSLQSESLKSTQKEIELSSTRKSILESLSVMTGKLFDEKTIFTYQLPKDQIPNDKNNRPELVIFDMQTQLIESQKQLIESKKFPKIGAFAQTGYGRPALNFLSNDFDPYFMGGIRLNWMLNFLYNGTRDQRQLEIQKQQTQLQKENFLLNQKIVLQNYQLEINLFAELMVADKEIIDLKEKIKNAAEAQLEQGIITAADYIREVNALNQAQQNLSHHQLQLMLSILQYQNTKGD